MCRNDKKLLKYELNLELYGDVQPFEVEKSVMDKWKKVVEEFDIAWVVYSDLNKTYHEDISNYEGDMKQYKSDKEDATNDPYGDEGNQPMEPMMPVKPDQPTQPPASPVSIYEMQSVGRVYFNLTKPEASRWKKLVPEQMAKRPQNMGLWWELYEKYEKELVALEPFEDDDEDLVNQSKKDKKKEDKDSKPKQAKKSKVKTSIS
jgi:hypothetical protein